MTNNSKQFYSVFLFFFFLCFASSSSLNSYHKCSEKQSDALLLFKQSLSSINYSIDYAPYTPCKDFLGFGYYPIMMNWSLNTDCCNWDGITCDHFTGDVIGIDLSCGMLQGTIHPNSTLFHLPHLERLNLAFNNFTGSHIPHEIGRFSNSLTHLNISRCGLEGQIPSEILFLPVLISLDLSLNTLGFSIEPTVFESLLQNSTHLRELSFADVYVSSVLPTNISSSLKTLELRYTSLLGELPDNIFNLPYLEKLDLSSNYLLTCSLPKVNQSTNTHLKWLRLSNTDFSGKTLDSIGNLKYLNYLDLSETGLSGNLPNSIGNLTFLNYLDLSETGILGKIPNSIGNLRSLNHMKISSSNLMGSLPKSIGNLKSLNYLDLSYSGILGKIPDSIGNLTYLNYLHLARCNLTGSLPKSLLNLTDLATLNLHSNMLDGTLPYLLLTLHLLENVFLDDNMFSGGLPSELVNHSSLKILSLRDNQFDGEINQVPIQLMNLTYLDLSYNNFTSHWDLDTLLSSLPSLVALDLSYSGLSVVTNDATSHVNPGFLFLGLASCKLTMIPKSLQAMKTLEYLDLSSNDLKGRVPDWVGKIGGNELSHLNLSHNSITGLPYFQWNGLKMLSLQYNQIEGEFPTSICNMINLYFLDMSYNIFVGVIPQCFGNILSNILVVNMRNNLFHGTIPNVNSDSIRLSGLILNGNQLEGDVPSFLSKAQELSILDIGNNHLNGTFPTWLGDLPLLQVLVLKSNSLHGSIETFETSFTGELPFQSLQVLDLSHNELVGRLPRKYFQNFIAMKDVVASGPEPGYLALNNGFSSSNYYYSVTIAVKGQQLLFSKVMVDYTIVDISNNNFEGEIPDIIGTLNSLKVLNLSHNHLIGRIPHALGNLSAIESLDLSWNQLSGEIPQELADIASLEVLDLSQNHLVGHIPNGKQFNTFEEHSFGGNPGLCGLPLSRLCEKPSSLKFEDNEESGFPWRVVMLGYGCGTVIGMLMGWLMLSTGKPKWFNAIADVAEYMISKRQNKRRYLYIGK